MNKRNDKNNKIRFEKLLDSTFAVEMLCRVNEANYNGLMLVTTVYSGFTTSFNLKASTVNRVQAESCNVINLPNKARITLYGFVAVARSNKTAVHVRYCRCGDIHVLSLDVPHS